MIHAIHYLGRLSLKDKDLVEGMALPVSKKKLGLQQFVQEINLDIANERVDISNFNEVDDGTPLEYTWLGSADGANSPQWYGTTSNLEWLVSQTLTNLIDKWDPEDSFFYKLVEARNEFFNDFGCVKKADDRYRYVLNPKYYDATLKSDNGKNAGKEAGKLFSRFIENENNLKPSQIQLYALLIDGQKITDEPFYKKMIIREKDNVFEKSRYGICAVTGEKGPVAWETTKLKFNYYINDKISFASKFEKKGYLSNLPIGKSAYHNLLAGEAFIRRTLETRFAGLKCYMIPEFLFPGAGDELLFSIDGWGQIIKDFLNTAKSIPQILDLKEQINNYRKYEDEFNQVTLNLLFFVKEQASFKINKLIQNIPFKNIYDFLDAMSSISEISRKYFGENHTLENMGLENIYYLIPMREKQGDNFEKKKILHVYESLLLQKPIRKSWIREQIVQLGKIYYFEQFEPYQFKKPKIPEYAMIQSVLKGQWLIYITEKLKTGGKQMVDIQYELQDETMTGYMTEMNYSVSQSAMFLLGTLISRVATHQYRSGNQTKPILNKINFQGMNKVKLRMLSTDVKQKLVQLEKTPSVQNEFLFGEHKRLFDLALMDWDLNDKDSVFYLLSGYSFEVQRTMRHKKESQNDEIKKEAIINE